MIEIHAVLNVVITVDSEGPMTDAEVTRALTVREQANRAVSRAIEDAVRMSPSSADFYALSDDNRACYLRGLVACDVEKWSSEQA